MRIQEDIALLKLEEKIRDKSATIGIVGLGYVGLPLAVAFAEAGFKVLGVDIQQMRVDLVNELAQLCHNMNVSVWEVIDAASTRLFGYMPFHLGPGVGGHCIPLDPYYLASKAREFDFHTRFIELAAEINERMPYYVVLDILEVLNTRGKSPNLWDDRATERIVAIIA